MAMPPYRRRSDVDLERRVLVGLGVVSLAAIFWQAFDTSSRKPLAAMSKPKPLDPNAPSFAVDIVPAPKNLTVIGLPDAVLGERGISRRKLGTVDFPTGAIVAADPLVQPERPAFARKVPPGRYDVEVVEASRRVALLVVRFAPGTPERWQMALLPGQDARTLKPDEIFYYPVDTGLGTLMDARARDALLERNRREEARRSDFNGYDDVVAAPLKAAGDRMVLLKPLADDPAIVPIVESGWGDGIYATYWGFGASDQPLVIATDFGVLDDGDGREKDKR